MRKIFTLIMMFVAMGVTAVADTQKAYVGADNNGYDHYMYYNAQGQLVWELFGTSRYEYEYDASGLCVKRQTYTWVSASGEYTKGAYELYEYDAEGNVSKTTVMKKPYGKTEYAVDDEFWNYTYADGFAATWDNYYKGSLYYNYRNVLEKDGDGNVSKVTKQRFDPDAPAKGWVDESYMTYQYAGFDAAYAPANFKAQDNGGEVTLSWDAVPGAEKYIVSYDQTRQEVTSGTSLVVTLGTGERQFAVQAVIGGTERNASFANAEIVDPGKLPIADLAVEKMEKYTGTTESTEMDGKRDFYNIYLNWTLPEGHSEVAGFKVYYNSQTYGWNNVQSVSDKGALSYMLQVDPFEMAEQDEEGNLVKGVETEVYVTVMYVTGESEKSNVVTVNPFKDLGDEPTGITSVVTSTVNSGKAFNLAGQQVGANAKGVIIMNGKKVIRK